MNRVFPAAETLDIPASASLKNDRLQTMAEVAVHVGLGLAHGQQLLITAPLDALALVRKVTAVAYGAGASLVTTMFVDDEATLARYRYADDASFDTAAGWLHDGIAAAYRAGAARLGITGSDPALLAGQDPVKVARANVAQSIAGKPAMQLITRHAINWSIVAAATPAWARAVFPGEPEDAATAKLWDAIFAASRIDTADPVAEWKLHSASLQARAALLNAKRYHALAYRGPGTDLRIGLSDGHIWLGGGTTAENGLACLPNIPTEEVFTTPHKDRVEGTVASTKPLSHQGTLIEEISVRFAGGRVVEARAKTGQAVLEKMLATDEGAARLGEVALVPHSSPISASGLLFSNTLFDAGGDAMSAGELAARGANSSLIHVDWMIGSGQVDIDGITATGAIEPLMRSGEWV